MPQRYSGANAQVSLDMGSGFVSHDGPAGRTQLRSRFPRDTTRRALPGGVTVTIPRLIRTGSVSWQAVRTAAIDKQLAAAIQQKGTIRIRPEGAGSSKPQILISAIIKPSLTITAGGLCIWTVNATLTGTPNFTAQS